jgi:hypothetical protein
MSLNTFRPKKFEDFEIVSDDSKNEVVGHIRIKPSGILWSPPHAKVWYGITLDQFKTFIEANGKKQKK